MEREHSSLFQFRSPFFDVRPPWRPTTCPHPWWQTCRCVEKKS